MTRPGGSIGGGTDEGPDTWVLLHGTPLGPDVWKGVSDALGAERVCCPRTYVDGATPPVQRTVSSRLLAALPSGRWHVVGHSFGGQVALELALLAGDRVRSLSVVCSRDTPFPSFAGLADAVRSGRAPDPEATLARWFTPRELTADGEVVRQVRATLAAADPVAWADALDAISTYDRSADAKPQPFPMHLVCAEDDGVSGPEAMTSFAHRWSAALTTVPGGHMSPFVDPRRLADMLREGGAV